VLRGDPPDGGAAPPRHGAGAHEGLNDRLQSIESEADRLMLELYRDLYNSDDALKFMLRRDLFEILEKAIDRCRDVGNVIYHVVLKNS
jgi:uncharacterized protein Yka (UPF0111/DUF47 family)